MSEKLSLWPTSRNLPLLQTCWSLILARTREADCFRSLARDVRNWSPALGALAEDNFDTQNEPFLFPGVRE